MVVTGHELKTVLYIVEMFDETKDVLSAVHEDIERYTIEVVMPAPFNGKSLFRALHEFKQGQDRKRFFKAWGTKIDLPLNTQTQEVLEAFRKQGFEAFTS
jgi:hypothetical protein